MDGSGWPSQASDLKQIGFSQTLPSAYSTQFSTEVVRQEVSRRELSGSRVGGGRGSLAVDSYIGVKTSGRWR